MRNDLNSPEEPRKPYRKPEVKQFPLRPDEAVLGFCKTVSGGGGPYGNHCKNVTSCNSAGS